MSHSSIRKSFQFFLSFNLASMYRSFEFSNGSFSFLSSLISLFIQPCLQFSYRCLLTESNSKFSLGLHLQCSGNDIPEKSTTQYDENHMNMKQFILTDRLTTKTTKVKQLEVQIDYQKKQCLSYMMLPKKTKVKQFEVSSASQLK